MKAARITLLFVAGIAAALAFIIYIPFLFFFIGQQWDGAGQWNCSFYHGTWTTIKTLDGITGTCVPSKA